MLENAFTCSPLPYSLTHSLPPVGHLVNMVPVVVISLFILAWTNSQSVVFLFREAFKVAPYSLNIIYTWKRMAN